MTEPKLSKEVPSLLLILLSRLTNPTALTMAFMFLAVFYLIPNARLIGADASLIYSYSIMLLIVLGVALLRKVPLQRLDWRAKDALMGKYIKKPQELHWAVLFAVLMFSITVAICLWRYSPGKADLPVDAMLSIAWQQLLIITLAETVIFQGIIPLIVEKEIEMGAKEAKKTLHPVAMLLTVIIFSQMLFGLSHYSAYGGIWLSMIWATMVGSVWYLMARYFGIMSAWFSHFGLNIVALGLIALKAAEIAAGV